MLDDFPDKVTALALDDATQYTDYPARQGTVKMEVRDNVPLFVPHKPGAATLLRNRVEEKVIAVRAARDVNDTRTGGSVELSQPIFLGGE